MASRTVRSRADKRDKDKASPIIKEAPSTQNINNDIVPGRFTEQDWNNLLQEEEKEDFIMDIFDEILTRTMTSCYEKYIEQQLIPYTVYSMKDKLLDVINWEFLSRDMGEFSNSTYIEDEDEEPCSAILDSWAPGAVPYKVFHNDQISKEDSHQSICLDNQLKENEQNENQRHSRANSTKDLKRLPSQKLNTEISLLKNSKNDKPVGFTNVKRTNSDRSLRYKGPLKSPGLKNITKTLLESELEIEEKERSKSLSRLNSTRLDFPNHSKNREEISSVIIAGESSNESVPNRFIKTTFSVVDPQVEAAQARLIAMQTGRYQPVDKVKGSKTEKRQEFMNEQQKSYERATSSSVAPVPPPLIESMDVVPGVTVREGGRVKQGLKRNIQHGTNSDLSDKQLKPVLSNKVKQSIVINDIIGTSVPKIIPLPPIVQN